MRDQLATSSGPLSSERERAFQPKDIFTECKDCPELVVVLAGSFMMGSPNGEAFAFMVGAPNSGRGLGSDESLQHKVTIEKAFAVGRTAVTFDEWDACVADSGCAGYKPADQGWGRGQRPVINVSWNDIQSYLTWLSRKTGKPYRLLSEAEFEYVARAGSKTAYPWGAEIGKGNAQLLNQALTFSRPDELGGPVIGVRSQRLLHKNIRPDRRHFLFLLLGMVPQMSKFPRLYHGPNPMGDCPSRPISRGAPANLSE